MATKTHEELQLAIVNAKPEDKDAAIKELNDFSASHLGKDSRPKIPGVASKRPAVGQEKDPKHEELASAITSATTEEEKNKAISEHNAYAAKHLGGKSNKPTKGLSAATEEATDTPETKNPDGQDAE